MRSRSLRRLLPAFAIAGLLLLPTLQTTVRALPLFGPDGPAARWERETLLSWLGQTFASLWADSEGSPIPVSPDPLDGGAESDTGKLIDPDG